MVQATTNNGTNSMALSFTEKNTVFGYSSKKWYFNMNTKPVIIVESYFGSELEVIDVIHSKYGDILVVKKDDNSYAFYNDQGFDPTNLSTIEPDEFHEALEIKEFNRIKYFLDKITI
jgi:hypothetical protein